MKKIRKISVIVPVYNVNRYLRDCIESVCNQSYENLEIILMDDGSTDGSEKICDEYAMMDNRIKVIHQSNGGISNARNNAIKIATGDYIGFVDSDDIIHPKMYEILCDALEDNDTDIVICHEQAFKDEEQVYFENCTTYNVEFIEDRDQLLSHECDDWTGPANWVWNKLYRAEIVKKIKFVEGRNMEDVMYSSDIFYNTKKAVWIENILYGYRQRAGSIMNSKKLNINIQYAEALLYQRDNIYKTRNTELITKMDSYVLRKIASLRKEIRHCDEEGWREYDKKIKIIFNELYREADKSEIKGLRKIKLFCARYAFHLYELM